MKKSVIITDLDNTLFDWLKFWNASFSAFLNKLLDLSGIDRKILISEIKKIHQTHGTSEYAFLIESIPSLLKKHQDTAPKDIPAIYDEAIYAYNSARKKNLVLYPNVKNTLTQLKEKGCLIIGYTDSLSFYAHTRVKKLDLDGTLDYLYSPPDHKVSDNIEEIRKYDANYYRFKKTIHNHLPFGEVKPNPQILKDIIKQVGAYPEQCLYIGDNKKKDIQMAQEASVCDVHAKYGEAHTTDEYKLLTEVTHWTAAEVKDEISTKIIPSYVLKDNFGEILDLFEFEKYD